MAHQPKISFLFFVPKDDSTRFGLFRMADDTMTHIMGSDGFWIAVPQDDDDKLNDQIHHMLVDKLLPQFRQGEDTEADSRQEKEDAETFQESPDDSIVYPADESDELSIRVVED